MKKLLNYIGGKGAEPASKIYFDSFNPAKGEVLYQVPDSAEADVEAAVSAAEKAYPAWSAMPIAQRAAILNRIADIVESRVDAIARMESEDQGKLYTLAKSFEIPRVVTNFRFFARVLLQHEERAAVVDTDALHYTQRLPVGVVGLISPWNMPLYLMTWKIAPAIAFGNTVVCKPSEMTSLTASLLPEIFAEAGLPAGVVNIVFGKGTSAGGALVKHPRVPAISFTGGTATGEWIAREGGAMLKKVSLELGGKNAALVFDDADLAKAVPELVRGAFQNQGEICLCTSRVFVQRKVYQKFVDAFVVEARNWKPGDPLNEGTKMGALVSEQHLAKVVSYVELAKKEGGKVVLGGDRPQGAGYFLNPTVIEGLPATCRTMQEEIFGPVVGITPFDDEAQVMEWANGTKYGLAASVWTTDVQRAHRVAHALRAGSVWVNAFMKRDLRMPFGGMKSSGVGREGGEDSLEFFTDVKSVAIQL